MRLRPKRAHPSHLHTNAPLRSNWLGLKPSDGSPVVDQSVDPKATTAMGRDNIVDIIDSTAIWSK